MRRAKAAKTSTIPQNILPISLTKERVIKSRFKSPKAEVVNEAKIVPTSNETQMIRIMIIRREIIFEVLPIVKTKNRVVYGV